MDKKASDKKRRLQNVMLVTAIIVASSIIYLCVVKFLNIAIPCNFRLITGRLCPGCGMTRAAFSLLHMDFSSAFSYNALSLTLMPLAALYAGFRAYKYINYANYKTHHWEYFLWVGFALGIVVFTVIRNLH